MDETDKDKTLESKLSNSEKRLRRLFDRRDSLNEEARFMRNERDSLNSRRREVIESIRKLKDKRHAEMEDLKKRRDEVTAPYRIQRDKLNAMVKVQKRKREGLASSMSSFRDGEESEKKKRRIDPLTEINVLSMEMQALLSKYETVAMSRDKEQEAMDQIKDLKRRIDELEKVLPDYQLKELEKERKVSAREDIFQDHDMAHQSVVELSQKAQEFHTQFTKENDKFREKMDSIYNKYIEEIEGKEKEIGHLSLQADRRHKEFLAMKERADHYHKRAMALRGEVLVLRKEKNAVEQKMRDLIDEQNRNVDDALEDEEKQKEAADKAMELLKKGGKISL